MKNLLVILGPTASGKSSLAISLAERFTGEVVRVDPLKYAPDLADFKSKVADHIPLSVTLFE